MSATDKTSRCFNFLLWLLEAGKNGISVDHILKEYHISKKTFLRDIKEMSKINDLLAIRYNKVEQRIYASWKNSPTFTQKKIDKVVRPNESPLTTFFHQLDNKKLVNNDKVYVSLNVKTELNLQTHELNYLLNGIINQEFVNFTYHQKERNAIPLLICEYSGRWYLLALVHPIGKVFKFRIDEIEKVELKCYKQPLSVTSLLKNDKSIDALKRRVLKVLASSQNIFVDLNHIQTLKITFRFYFPLDFLKKEIKGFNLLSKRFKTDPSVHDIEIGFSGYEEARTFLNKWLGKYSILKPDWIAEQYINDVEEFLDMLQI